MSSIRIANLPEDQQTAERLIEMLSGTYKSLAFLPDTPVEAQHAIDESQMLLVLISDNWAERVLSHDAVYTAIQRGLDHPELPVLALLLDDASLPGVTDMPTDLRALLYMSAAQLHTDERFREDVTALAHQMAEYLKQTAESDVIEELVPSARTDEARKSAVPFNVILIGLILAFAAFLLLRPVPDSGIPDLPDIVFGRTDAGNASESDAVTADVDVLLGVAASFSGGTSQRGGEILNGIQLAVQNRQQVTVDDVAYTIDLLTQDSGCSAVGGERVAELFAASPNLMAVIGHMCNASCAASIHIYESSGLAAISPACTEPDLTTPDRRSFARVIPSDAAAASAAADYVYDTITSSDVAVVYDEQRFATQFAEAFIAQYENRGGNIGTRYATETGTISYETIAETVTANESPAVYFAGRASNAAGIRQALIESGAADVPFIAAVGDNTDTYIEAAGEAADGTYFVQLASPPDETLEGLATRYQEAYGEVPQTTAYAYAYDAANLLLDAIEASATGDGESIRVDPATLRDAIRNYSGEGVTGTLNCDAKGECASTRAEIHVVESGSLTTISDG